MLGFLEVMVIPTLGTVVDRNRDAVGAGSAFIVGHRELKGERSIVVRRTEPRPRPAGTV